MTTVSGPALGGHFGGSRDGRAGIAAHRLQHDVGLGVDGAALVLNRKR